jgi:hypothetical protein
LVPGALPAGVLEEAERLLPEHLPRVA